MAKKKKSKKLEFLEAKLKMLEERIERVKKFIKEEDGK